MNKLDNKVKFYCVKFDMMPLLKEMIELANSNGMKKFLQVGGCFTYVSLFKMFTGGLPSDYIKHGIGYCSLDKYRDKSSKKMMYFPSYKDFIMSKLDEREWDIKTHNAVFESIIHGNIHTSVYNDFFEAKQGDGPMKRKIMRQTFLFNNEEAIRWKKKEYEFIQSIQKEKPKNNTFYFIDYQHFHSLWMYKNKIKDKKMMRATIKKIMRVTIKNIIELINVWDFNEPNSVFWFFSDHGYPFAKIPKASNYLSWVFLKDNVVNNNFENSNSSIISIRDFLPSVMKKFNYSYKETKESYSIFSPIDKDRIYLIEDSRLIVDKYNSTTATACKIIKWIDDNPIKILQVSYFSEKNKFYYSFNILDKEGFFKKNISLSRANKTYKDDLLCLKLELLKRFEWVKE